jgi:hypothetical protein
MCPMPSESYLLTSHCFSARLEEVEEEKNEETIESDEE